MTSYLSSSSVNQQNWEMMLNRLLKKRELIYWEQSPLIENTFEELSCICRIRILRCICDWLIEDSHVFYGCVDRLYDNWRIFPLGKDKDNHLYWYLDDFRLYREEVNEKDKKQIKKDPDWIKNPPTWTIQCRTMRDWDDFLESLKDTKHKKEKKLYEELESLIPQIKEEYDEKEKEILRLEMLNAPIIKRSTRIQAREIQRMEEEKHRYTNGTSNDDSDEMRIELR